MKKKIVLSSGNKNKVKEIKNILKDMDFDVISKDDLGFIDFDVIEDKETLEDNAYKKAFELKELIDKSFEDKIFTSSIMVLADDTGLFVDALNGEPGVYSARYAGEQASYQNNNKLLLEKLSNVPMEKRTAKFKTVIVIIRENNKLLVAEGICNGKIAFEPRGKNGFGYDPLFIVDGTNKTFSEMSDEEKNIISHRAKAIQNLRERLGEI